MAEEKTKGIEVINGNPVEYASGFDFGKAYDDWKSACQSIGKDLISPKPKGAKNPKTKAVPANLYLQVKGHATASNVRAESPNKGDTGIYRTLNAIEGAIKDKRIFTKVDQNVLIEFKDELESHLSSDSLNPQNIKFKRPKNWRKRGDQIKIIGSEKQTIYGHYIDEYFVAKYPEFDPPEGWKAWSSTSEDTAKPPLYQAIYEGTMVSPTLMEVLEIGIKATQIPIKPILRKTSSDILAQVPAIKSWVIKNAKRFFKDGKYNLSAFRGELNNQDFKGSENAKLKRLLTAAITGRKLSSIKTNQVLSHPIETYSVELRTNSAMANLIKNSFQRSVRAKDPARQEIKKWFMML